MKEAQAAFLFECQYLSQIKCKEEYREQLEFVHSLIDLDWEKYKGWSVVEIIRDWEEVYPKRKERG